MTKVCGANLLDASMEYKHKSDARGSHVTAALRVSLALYGVSREVVHSDCGEAIATEYMSSTHLGVSRTARQAHESGIREVSELCPCLSGHCICEPCMFAYPVISYTAAIL